MSLLLHLASMALVKILRRVPTEKLPRPRRWQTKARTAGCAEKPGISPCVSRYRWNSKELAALASLGGAVHAVPRSRPGAELHGAGEVVRGAGKIPALPPGPSWQHSSPSLCRPEGGGPCCPQA